MVAKRWSTYEDYDPEYYDQTFDKERPDIDFYLEQARQAGGKVLEIACGSGRVYLDLLKNGVDIYGIDLSGKMLNALKKKAEAMNLEPKVKLADMRSFWLDEKFSLIIIPARSFLHNLTSDDQVGTLKSCRKNLAEGGRLVLTFFYPDPEIILNDYGREIVQPVQSAEKGLELARFSRFADELEQVVEFTFDWRRDGRSVSTLNSHISIIYKREFELLLRLAGFSRWQVYGGFDLQPLESPKQEMVWIIEK